MKLFIIRHGDPDYKHDSLTPLGKRQAEALSKRFAVNPLDKIFSSPMGRAKDTAMPTCEVLKKEMTILDWTSEEHAYSEMNIEENGGTRWCFHKQITDYKNDATIRLYDNWKTADKDFLKPTVESGLKRIADESDKFLKELGYERCGSVYKILKPSEETVAVFCHQGFSLAWFTHLMQIPPHIVWSTFDVSHSGVTLFNFENYENGITAPKCLMLSDLSHILNAGLPMKYQNNLDI